MVEVGRVPGEVRLDRREGEFVRADVPVVDERLSVEAYAQSVRFFMRLIANAEPRAGSW